jgi:hypothetical protein
VVNLDRFYCIYIYIYIYMLQLVRVIRLSRMSAVRRQSTDITTRIVSHIFTLLPADDGLLASPKHVDVL